MKDFILTRRVNPAEQGTRLTRIWKELIIRRTPQSRIPFDNDVKIINSLSRVKIIIISCLFIEEEKKIYNAINNTLIEKLLSAAETHKKFR